MGEIKGYKVFNPDWKCKDKQYTCPGKFEEEVELSICTQGMHFCRKAADCFDYYSFDPKNKVAEVIAYGTVIEKGNKSCTDKLEIVREIPWQELLEIVNTGYYNTGLKNSGYSNSGNHNSGHWNSGNCNSGNHNSGHCNSGDYNSGNWNSGDYNSGSCNSGNFNSGYSNSGNYNSGDWNKCDFSNGCFNTIDPKIYLFNRHSELTYTEWSSSKAHALLCRLEASPLEWVKTKDMTNTEKKQHPEAKTTGGYLKKLNKDDRRKKAVTWWKSLLDKEKEIIKQIPNFDKEIFKEIVGVDVEKD